MKAITLYQPWATLKALNEKKIETRSWATNYRGPLAIHAGTNKAYIKMRGKDYICGNEPFRSVLNEACRNHYQHNHLSVKFMPLGAIVAICNLVDCVKIIGQTHLEGMPIQAQLENGQIVEGNELAFGDYTPGRYAWIIEDTTMLTGPIPVKGWQGLWNWEPPEEWGGKQ